MMLNRLLAWETAGSDVLEKDPLRGQTLGLTI